MARKIYMDDGHGNPVGKVNIEIRVDEANWLRARRRSTMDGAREPMYSVMWRLRTLFDNEHDEVSELMERDANKDRVINKLYERIRELEAENEKLKKPNLPGYVETTFS